MANTNSEMLPIFSSNSLMQKITKLMRHISIRPELVNYNSKIDLEC